MYKSNEKFNYKFMGTPRFMILTQNTRLLGNLNNGWQYRINAHELIHIVFILAVFDDFYKKIYIISN